MPRRRRYAGVTCPHCATPLDHEGLGTGALNCPYCGGPFRAARFDPPGRAVQPAALGEDGGACAAHPGNAATGSCDRCGVFMCSLCRIEADEMALCPGCFDRLSAEGALPSTVLHFRDYGRLASSLALAGILLLVVGLLFGPLAIYYGARSLKQRRELGEPGGRLSAWLAILAGVLETGVGVFVIVAVASAA